MAPNTDRQTDRQLRAPKGTGPLIYLKHKFSHPQKRKILGLSDFALTCSVQKKYISLHLQSGKPEMCDCSVLAEVVYMWEERGEI